MTTFHSGRATSNQTDTVPHCGCVGLNPTSAARCDLYSFMQIFNNRSE